MSESRCWSEVKIKNGKLNRERYKNIKFTLENNGCHVAQMDERDAIVILKRPMVFFIFFIKIGP